MLIGSFLDHLERERRYSVRTRNNRLAAIHSLLPPQPCATQSTQR